MTRLLVHVEGETEESFVNSVLAAHLYSVNRRIEKVAARLVGNSRQRLRRGGICAWPAARSDIIKHLKEDPGAKATTMIDYYALPQSGPGAWPGRREASTVSFEHKAETVEEALLNDVRNEMGPNFNHSRFIPFVMMHEFEGLLFSDCTAFGSGIGRPELSASFQSIRDSFATPEHINDSPLTAPSKRILSLLPNYEKPLLGTLAVLEIGLLAIREQCPHFEHWISRLEQTT